MKFYYYHYFGHAAYAILVPWPGIEPMALAVEVQSPNHWTTREVPVFILFIDIVYICFSYEIE